MMESISRSLRQLFFFFQNKQNNTLSNYEIVTRTKKVIMNRLLLLTITFEMYKKYLYINTYKFEVIRMYMCICEERP